MGKRAEFSKLGCKKDASQKMYVNLFFSKVWAVSEKTNADERSIPPSSLPEFTRFFVVFY